jgi:predicted nucleic acid-binding Zn ribbon protein
VTRDEPRPLRDALAAVRKELGLPEGNNFEVLVAMWPDIVGIDVAQHTRVRSLRDGECTVEVDEPAWATRVRYLTSDLLRLANERCGEGVVTGVRVVVTSPRTTI